MEKTYITWSLFLFPSFVSFDPTHLNSPDLKSWIYYSTYSKYRPHYKVIHFSNYSSFTYRNSKTTKNIILIPSLTSEPIWHKFRTFYFCYFPNRIYFILLFFFVRGHIPYYQLIHPCLIMHLIYYQWLRKLGILLPFISYGCYFRKNDYFISH